MTVGTNETNLFEITEAFELEAMKELAAYFEEVVGK